MRNTLTHLTVFLFALMMITVSVNAQTHTMTSGNYSLTGTVTYYDPGGAGGGVCPSAVAGNYANNLDITEVIQGNAGQKIVLSWAGGLFGISTGDVLTVYDGPTTASPVIATYTNTTNPVPSVLGATSSNTMTLRFVTDGTNTCKGWQATVTSYYFMQPGNFSFACPGTYTFVDYQSPGTTVGGPGGDATCQATGGNSKDYQDVSMIETFSTGNGQCIQVDGSFPNNFGICAGDTLTAYDGPSILSPIANGGTWSYTNTFAAPATFSTLGNSVTFEFAASTNYHARGWQMAMTCVNCPPASINNDCANAIILTPGASCNSIASSVSVSNSNANPFLAPTCTGTNTANDDVWYRFTCNNANTQITVMSTDGSMDPVIQLFYGTCGSFTSLYCHNSSGAGGSETINATGLSIGTTYYLRVYDANTSNANHTFSICVVGNASTDCEGAQQVCSTSQIAHSNLNYPDFGTQEYNSAYWGCEVSGESRSAWYYWQVETSGTFGFTISALPGSSYMDNDFVLWGPLSGLSCPMNTVPLRCSRAIAYASNAYGLPPYSTGLEMGAGDNTEGASGDAFVETVNAVAGQWYVLLVNIYSGPASYNITWMDNIPANQQATFVLNEANITAAGPTTFCKGDSVDLTVTTPGLTYQWKKGNNIIVGATQQTFSAAKSGNYKCNVSNNCGTATSNTISVTVNPKPTVTVSQDPCSGGVVLLTCTPDPNTGVTFKWRKNGSPISGAINSTYSATQSATYKCNVTITATGCTKLSAGINVIVNCKSGEANNDNESIVYPNPTSDYFNINTTQLDPQSVLNIYDLTGRLVESHEVSGGEMQVGRTLSNGVYFLKIELNHETQQVIKMVKNF